MNFRFYSAPEVVRRAVVGIGWLALAGGAYVLHPGRSYGRL